MIRKYPLTKKERKATSNFMESYFSKEEKLKRPFCRDCADNDGFCPNDNTPCAEIEVHRMPVNTDVTFYCNEHNPYSESRLMELLKKENVKEIAFVNVRHQTTFNGICTGCKQKTRGSTTLKFFKAVI